MMRRTAIKPMSSKKLASLGGRAFSTIARVAMTPKAQPAKKLERSMGTKARKAWISAKPCLGCGIEGYSVNAHIVEGTQEKGMGFKAHHRHIGPLCDFRPDGDNCHDKFDERKAPFDALPARVILITKVAIIAAEWDALEARA